jgi:serine/threonine-protein kinase
LNLAFAEKAMIARDVILDDLDHAAHRPGLAAAFREMRASLLFPFVYEPEVWGVLAIGDRPNLKPYRRSEHVALKRVAEQAAVRLRDAYRRIRTSKFPRSGPRVAEMAPEFPPHIGGYRIDRFLGKGGMAVVFRGWSEGRPYAIKVPNLAVQNDATMMSRFAHEARALRRLRHPHVITVDEVGDESGEPWIAMEYLPMGTLADHLKKVGPVEEALARTLTRQLALGLAAAQGENIIHRDVKPHNIFFISSDTVKLGDFGLAKVGDMTTLTTMTKLMGTPGYIGPEIWENKGADWASDQYALGITFYEMIAGERPFKADSVVGIMKSHLFMPPPDIRERCEGVSAHTSSVLIRMLAKKPADRFSSYAELVAALT